MFINEDLAPINGITQAKTQRFQAIKTSSQKKKMIRFRNINHKTLALYDKTCNFAKIKYFSYHITVNKLVYK